MSFHLDIRLSFGLDVHSDFSFSFVIGVESNLFYPFHRSFIRFALAPLYLTPSYKFPLYAYNSKLKNSPKACWTAQSFLGNPDLVLLKEPYALILYRLQM